MKQIAGFTLIELVITVAILGILASAAMPMLQMTVKRQKEQELKANLRQIRNALDAYKAVYDSQKVKDEKSNGYPSTLDALVEGLKDPKDPKGRRVIKFLRRIPIDPMLSTQQIKDAEGDRTLLWGVRSYESSAEEPKAGEDVYDIYSLSPLVGSNGVPYAQW